MILALVPLAAASLPWACPSFSTPEEAYAYRTDGGLPDLFDALEAEARTWWDDDCAWTSTTLSDGSVEESCTTDAGASLTATSLSWEDFDAIRVEGERWTLDVVLPDGADAWTSVSLVHETVDTSSGRSYSSTTTLEATWTGTVVADAPAASSFVHEAQDSDGYDTLAVTTPDCAWRWEEWDETVDGGSWIVETVYAPDHDVAVVLDMSPCSDAAGYRVYASVDGALFGAVDRDTWALDEEDLDGWSVDAGDCDDTDPTVYPCATEEAVGDGWDQDCDGTDDTDEDGDGYVTDAANGDDCDDRASGTHPGAADPAGDDVDQNCDGADEVDADGDGFTVDGDDGEADCDDTTWTIRPDANDRPCDGLDQDCDGADACDGDSGDSGGSDDTAAGDTAADDTAAPADDDAEGPKEEPTGCASGASALLFLPLVPALTRRRRRR